MAKVEWADAIKTVSGAMTKINKKSQHAEDQKMVLATHRVAPTQSTGCSRIYLRGLSAVTRKTPLTTNDLFARNRFTAVAAAVVSRSKDVTKISQDQQAFMAQKDLAGGKQTLKAYYWKICGDEYDLEHPRG